MSLHVLLLMAAEEAPPAAGGDTSATCVVMFIVALSALALLAGLFTYLRYGSERTALRRARRNLAQIQEARQPSEEAYGEEGEGTEPSPAERVGPAPVAVDDLLPGVRQGSLIHDRLQAIRKMRLRRIKVDPEALQRLNLARDATRLGLVLPRFGAGTCLLLGILGTFLGLASVVNGIEAGLPGQLDPADFDAWSGAARELRTVVGGMGTAFTTSLAGIVAALVCSFMDFVNRRRRGRLFNELEHFTLEDLLPELVPATEDETLLQEVTHRLEASFERLDDIQRANEEVLKDLTGAQQAFAVIVDEMKRLSGSDARQDLRKVISHLDQTSRSMLSLAEEMPKIVRAVERGSGGLQRQVRVFLHRWFPVSLVLILLTLVWAFVIAPG